MVPGCRRVDLLNCSEEVFALLVRCMQERTVIPLSEQKREVVETFQKLAWLQEWCRLARVQKLQIVRANGGKGIELLLEDLIETPKQCSLCSRPEQFVTCAKCGVATWCSERCVRKHYEEHQSFCKGKKRKNGSGLFYFWCMF